MTPEDWMQARLIGENEDGERINSADDEDIDSDAAFDESDEERYAGFFSSKKKRPKQKNKKQAVRFVDVDLKEDEDVSSVQEEEEEEEEEGDPDEFIDLLDVLDGKGEIDMESDAETPPSRKRKASTNENRDLDEEEEEEQEEGEEQEDEEEEEEQEDEEENINAFSASDEESAPAASEEFEKFISNLDTSTKKRKADETDVVEESEKEAQSRKRRIIAERTEAGQENEFRAHASGSKLQLDDLLAPLATQSSNLLSLKKNTKALSESSTKVKTLSAPLPQRVQERLNRQAAYEKTKEDAEKWSAAMKRIREAEHLSFPLQAKPVGRVSNLELAAKFKPSTALENTVDSLLKSAKMRDEDLPETENTMLQASKLTVEEVVQRRAELRRMRELMFRAELKAKRINRIKSKTYRKIKRKEKERLKEKLREAGEDESGEDEARMKKEMERARERATLRHKNTGKWARQKQHKHLDAEGRQEVEEMLARGEELRRKIQGIGSDESEEDDSDDMEEDGEDDADGAIGRIKQSAFDELKHLTDETPSADLNGKLGKSVFEMKFMKDARTREERETDKMVDDFIKEMGGHIDGPNEEGSADEAPEDPDPTSGVLVSRVGGRVVYRPGTTTQSSRQSQILQSMGSLPSDTSSVTLKSTDFLSPPPVSPEQTFKFPVELASNEETNPWLIRNTDSTAAAARKKNEVFGKESKKSEKSKNKLKKLARKLKEERDKAREDAVVEISLDNNLTLENSSKPMQSKQSTKSILSSKAELDADKDDSDADSEIEAQEQATLKTKVIGTNAKGLKAFQQRDLVALAFAGDNVVHEFEEAKKREIATDAPKEVDTTIPGWGSWGGAGTRRAPPKPARIKKIPGIEPTTRADYNKNNIIISEKRDKKAAKYLVKDLPYPYTSRAQFEHSMEQPLGKEWNTRVGFQRGTLPRIVKKPGVIIDPLESLS